MWFGVERSKVKVTKSINAFTLSSSWSRSRRGPLRRYSTMTTSYGMPPEFHWQTDQHACGAPCICGQERFYTVMILHPNDYYSIMSMLMYIWLTKAIQIAWHVYFASSHVYMYTDLLMNSPYYRYLRANAMSPVRYYSTYRDVYGERPWSPTHSQIIHDRVERALRRNRSLERLDRLRSYYPYTVCSSNSFSDPIFLCDTD